MVFWSAIHKLNEQIYVKSMSCKAFKCKKLTATKRFRFNVSDSCVVRNNEGINMIRLDDTDVGFLVVCRAVGVYGKHIRFEE